jgi:hypothetical protein
MNRLLKLLGYRDCEYHGDHFRVYIESRVREGVTVIYTRDGATLNLSGERIGRKWEGIEVQISQEVESSRAAQIARDLETAFKAMRYDYVIAAVEGTDLVPETERLAAITELRDMGYEVEVSADRNTIRQVRAADAPAMNREIARKQAPRMMTLLQSVHGRRTRLNVIAKSKDF